MKCVSYIKHSAGLLTKINVVKWFRDIILSFPLLIRNKHFKELDYVLGISNHALEIQCFHHFIYLNYEVSILFVTTNYTNLNKVEQTQIYVGLNEKCIQQSELWYIVLVQNHLRLQFNCEIRFYKVKEGEPSAQVAW